AADFSDGSYPTAGLIQASDGNLYGTTVWGGTDSWGTVFRMSLAGQITFIHSFTNGDDGANPGTELLQAADGDFYGTTSGFVNNWGGVFRMDSSGNVTTIHAFNGADGGSPGGPLIQAADENLYGTASQGGPAGGGVIYRMTTSSFAVNAITPTS